MRMGKIMWGTAWWRRFAPVMLAGSALMACTQAAPPEDHFYRLEIAAPRIHFETPAVDGILEVTRLESDGVLAERALAYQRDDGSVARYRYDLWSEVPTLLMQDALLKVLGESGAAVQVVPPDLRVMSDWVVRGKLRRFEQLPQGRGVVVAVSLAVVSARNGSLLLQRSYEVEIPTTSPAPETATAAIGRAVSRILDQFLTDLSTSRSSILTP